MEFGENGSRQEQGSPSFVSDAGIWSWLDSILHREK